MPVTGAAVQAQHIVQPIFFKAEVPTDCNTTGNHILLPPKCKGLAKEKYHLLTMVCCITCFVAWVEQRTPLLC